MYKKAIFVFTLILATWSIQAQNTAEEKQAVEKAVLNYIENFFENKFDAMNTTLHPRLAKRGLNPEGGMSKDLPPAKLKEIMQKKRAFPLEHQKNIVEDISIFGNMASANLTTGYPNMRWKEFVHLVKDNGEWKIINIFWEYFPKKPKAQKN